jgi:hypothetical protein
MAGALGDHRAAVLGELNIVRNFVAHRNKTSARAYRRLTNSRRGRWIDIDAFILATLRRTQRFELWVRNLQLVADAMVQ